MFFLFFLFPPPRHPSFRIKARAHPNQHTLTPHPHGLSHPLFSLRAVRIACERHREGSKETLAALRGPRGRTIRMRDEARSVSSRPPPAGSGRAAHHGSAALSTPASLAASRDGLSSSRVAATARPGTAPPHVTLLSRPPATGSSHPARQASTNGRPPVTLAPGATLMPVDPRADFPRARANSWRRSNNFTSSFVSQAPPAAPGASCGPATS